MSMTESKKAQAVGALRKCAKAHEKDFTFTCEIRVSDLCNGVADYVEKLQKENEELKKICDFNCPDHKFATHNACLTCPAIRNSPHHDLKNVTDEELQEIIKDAEAEMEM